MESDASSVEWIKGQRAKLARAKDRFVQSSAVTKGGISFVQHVASPFGRVLCLETRVPGLICAVTGDGSFVVWDQHYHLIDFERPKLDDRVSVACFCRQQNRTCTFFGVTERGTAFMAIAQFQGVTSTSGSGRPISAVTIDIRREGLFRAADRSGSIGAMSPGSVASSAAAAAAMGKVLGMELHVSQCRYNRASRNIIVVEGPQICGLNEQLEVLWKVNVLASVVSTSYGSESKEAEHDFRTRRMHSIASFAVVESGQLVFVGTRSGYLCRIDLRTHGDKVRLQTSLIKKFCETVIQSAPRLDDRDRSPLFDSDAATNGTATVPSPGSGPGSASTSRPSAGSRAGGRGRTLASGGGGGGGGGSSGRAMARAAGSASTSGATERKVLLPGLMQLENDSGGAGAGHDSDDEAGFSLGDEADYITLGLAAGAAAGVTGTGSSSGPASGPGSGASSAAQSRAPSAQPPGSAADASGSRPAAAAGSGDKAASHLPDCGYPQYLGSPPEWFVSTNDTAVTSIHVTRGSGSVGADLAGSHGRSGSQVHSMGHGHGHGGGAAGAGMGLLHHAYDDAKLVIGCSDGATHLLRVGSGHELAVFLDPVPRGLNVAMEGIACVAANLDASFLFTLDDRGTARTWNAERRLLHGVTHVPGHGHTHEMHLGLGQGTDLPMDSPEQAAAAAAAAVVASATSAAAPSPAASPAAAAGTGASAPSAASPASASSAATGTSSTSAAAGAPAGTSGSSGSSVTVQAYPQLKLLTMVGLHGWTLWKTNAPLRGAAASGGEELARLEREREQEEEKEKERRKQAADGGDQSAAHALAPHDADPGALQLLDTAQDENTDIEWKNELTGAVGKSSKPVHARRISSLLGGGGGGGGGSGSGGGAAATVHQFRAADPGGAAPPGMPRALSSGHGGSSSAAAAGGSMRSPSPSTLGVSAAAGGAAAGAASRASSRHTHHHSLDESPSPSQSPVPAAGAGLTSTRAAAAAVMAEIKAAALPGRESSAVSAAGSGALLAAQRPGTVSVSVSLNPSRAGTPTAEEKELALKLQQLAGAM